MRPARPSSSSYHCVTGSARGARAATCCSIRASESKTRPSDPRSAAPHPTNRRLSPCPTSPPVGWQGPDACEGFGSGRCDTGGSVRSLSRNITSGRVASASASACEASVAASNAASVEVRRVRRQPWLPGHGAAPRQRRRRGQSRPVRGCRPPSTRSNGRSCSPSPATIAPFRHAQPLRPPGASGTMARRCAPTRFGFPMNPHGPGLSRACPKAIVSREQRFDLRTGRTARPCEDSPMPAAQLGIRRSRCDRSARSVAREG